MSSHSAGRFLPFEVRPNFLPSDEMDALFDWALAHEARFTPALVDGGRLLPHVRQAMSLRDLGSLEPMLSARIAAIVPDLVASFRVTPFAVSEIELELAAHNDGAHFALHSDLYTGTRSRRGDRMLSAVLYFHREPRAFSGGELRLHRLGASPETDPGMDIVPRHNLLACFPAWTPHEVRPVSCPSGLFGNSRFALNCWVYRAPQ